MAMPMSKSTENLKLIVAKYGKGDVLQVAREPLKAPGAGEVRIRVEAAGVALADVMRREGLYPGGPTPPFTPGYDIVGVVDGFGSEAFDRGRLRSRADRLPQRRFRLRYAACRAGWH